MGIIIKQSIRGSIWSYLGVVIGFVTTAYLYPKFLSTNTVGLFGLLLAWSVLLAQFSLLGFNGVTSRLFPYFRDKKKGHNGFLFIAFMVMAVGFGLFLVFYFIFSPWLVENNAEKSQLFSQYIYLLIPLTFFTLLYSLLDNFNRLLYDAVLGAFLVEFLQRLFIFTIVLLFVFGWFSLHQLVLAFAAVVCIKGIILFFYLLLRGEMNLKPQLKFINKKLKNEMINVAVYSILAGLGGSIVFSIDKIIVNQMLGLSATGVYTIAFFFGTLVVIPSRTLLRISGTLISDAWKRNDVPYITDIYKRSCLNQFIIGAFLFGGIWVNIDSILIILGPEYAAGKWVIFLIALGYLVDMATGANGLVIAYSKYYKMSLWFILVLIGTVIASMYLFIPAWGIVGAAAAIALSFLLNNIMRFVFLYYKFGMQPFTAKFLLIFVALGIAYFFSNLLNQMQLIPDILIRSSIFTIVFGGVVLLLRVSGDVDGLLRKLLRR
ncbi:MAG: oligosaccharide flippase family protein [Draconibacterium sp.]|nr:oligosaccharide flippase family protein [Draconibacterium sp.]